MFEEVHESASAGVGPGTDIALVSSAADMTEQILTKGLEQIRNAGLDQEIDAHYRRKAQKVVRKLWRACRKATGHSFVDSRDMHDQRTCEHCGLPEGERAERRKKQGIIALGEKLRQADKEAGVEWIPS
jgi:hypothetical protein